MMDCVIYAGSHRKGGNSDLAAELLRQGVERAGGTAEIMHIRRYDVSPCLACGYCDTHPDKRDAERCVHGRKDQSWELFAPLFTCRCVLITSPIYFYHLPSRFKTWIDRGQQFWKAQDDGEPWMADLPQRTCRAVLVAGQPTGEKLFEGARLTLKYFLLNFNITLGDLLPIRGVDAPLDLKGRDELHERIRGAGEAAWNDAC